MWCTENNIVYPIKSDFDGSRRDLLDLISHIIFIKSPTVSCEQISFVQLFIILTVYIISQSCTNYIIAKLYKHIYLPAVNAPRALHIYIRTYIIYVIHKLYASYNILYTIRVSSVQVRCLVQV